MLSSRMYLETTIKNIDNDHHVLDTDTYLMELKVLPGFKIEVRTFSLLSEHSEHTAAVNRMIYSRVDNR